MARYTITALWRGGRYNIRDKDRIDAGAGVFTAVGGDAIQLSESGRYTLWEINGFRMHHAVLPLFRFLDAAGLPSCPVAVSDTRLALLLSEDVTAARLWSALQERETETARTLP